MKLARLVEEQGLVEVVLAHHKNLPLKYWSQLTYADWEEIYTRSGRKPLARMAAENLVSMAETVDQLHNLIMTHELPRKAREDAGQKLVRLALASTTFKEWRKIAWDSRWTDARLQPELTSLRETAKERMFAIAHAENKFEQWYSIMHTGYKPGLSLKKMVELARTPEHWLLVYSYNKPGSSARRTSVEKMRELSVQFRQAWQTYMSTPPSEERETAFAIIREFAVAFHEWLKLRFHGHCPWTRDMVNVIREDIASFKATYSRWKKTNASTPQNDEETTVFAAIDTLAAL